MKTLIVTLPTAPTAEFAGSRLKDVAEDIYKEFHFSGVAEVPDMDHATTTLHIIVHKTRFLGDVSTSLRKSLRKHGLEFAEISKH